MSKFADSSGPTTATTATTLTLTKPAGTRQGDLLIAIVYMRDGSADQAMSGWTLQRTVNGGASVMDTFLFFKVAGGSEPATYDVTWTTSNAEAGGMILVYRGIDAADPIDIELGQVGAVGSTYNISPTVTTTVAATIIRAALPSNDSTGSGGNVQPPTPDDAIPSSLTKRHHSVDALNMVWAITDVVQATPGATGDLTWGYELPSAGRRASFWTIAVEQGRLGASAVLS